MLFELKRNADAIGLTALATIEIEQDRPDIQSALIAYKNEGTSFPLRYERYLESEKLVKDGVLTDLGNEVCESGKMFAKEKGVYTIWYLNDKEYLKLSPLLIERSNEPVKGGYKARQEYYNWSDTTQLREDIENNVSKGCLLVNINNECDKRPFRNLKLEVINKRHYKHQPISIQLEYKYSNQDQAIFQVCGKLPVNNSGKEKNIDINELYSVESNRALLSELAASRGMMWCSESERFLSSVPEKTKQVNELRIESLNLQEVQTCYGLFKTGTASDLPLAPASNDIACEWQNTWLKNLYKNAYLSEGEGIYRQRIWLKQPALKPFNLKLKDGHELLTTFDRQEDRLSYWHSAATHFLTPKNVRSPLPSITLNKGDYFDTEVFLRYLTMNESIEEVIYSDRHYKSSLHKRNMLSVARIANVSDGLVLTSGRDAKVPDNWSSRLLDKSRDNHDRYWIFTTSENRYIWKVSTSFDFIDFSKDVAEILSPVTFTQLEDKYLPDYLKELVGLSEEVYA